MFIEIINTKNASIVVGFIHEHPKMDVLEFNNHLNQMLEKVSKEQKQIFFLEISMLICLIIMYINLLMIFFTH